MSGAAWECSSVEECIRSMHEALSWLPALKTGKEREWMCIKTTEWNLRKPKCHPPVTPLSPLKGAGRKGKGIIHILS